MYVVFEVDDCRIVGVVASGSSRIYAACSSRGGFDAMGCEPCRRVRSRHRLSESLWACRSGWCVEKRLKCAAFRVFRDCSSRLAAISSLLC